MAADTGGMMCVLGAMDSLWFHQIILFSEQSLFLPPETTEAVPLSHPETEDASSRNSSRMSVISQQQNSPVASDETSSQESDNEEEETSRHKERPTQPYLVPSKARCHSSSPQSAKNKSRKLRYSSYYTKKLQKTRSCKSLTELELEEVKGFMDLGFTFRKELLTNRLKKLIPGLQRIDAYKAWFTKRPDSPLLKFMTPRSATAPASEMKTQLKDWARTVALIIQQEP